MKTLLVIPDFKKVNNWYFMPIGIRYVSSYLKQQGHDIHCLNLNHHHPSKLKEVLGENSFDVVGTGGLFVDIAAIRSVIDTVRSHNPEIKIILGGAITADQEFILDTLKPDFLVLGEGEVTTDKLLKAIKNNTDIKQVTGIAFKENGKFTKTAPTPRIENLDELPFPDYEDFEFDYYLKHYPENLQHCCSVRGAAFRARVGYIISTRDCIAKCTFCFRHLGGAFYERSLTNVLNEINYIIKRYRINEIALLDDMFCATKERAREFSGALKKIGLPWRCQVRVTMIDDGLLKELKDAGCYEISYGFESASKRVLKSMGKGITPRQIKGAIEGSIKAKITIQGNFIFGDPEETLETMEETIRFARLFEKITFGFAFIIPYPGTVLYQNLVRRGKITDRLRFHEDPVYKLINMTSLSDVDYRYMIRKVQFERYRKKRLRCGKILRLNKIDNKTYDMDMRCHLCYGINDGLRLNFDMGEFIVCRHCGQRTFVNLADLRFRNFSRIIYQLYYHYIMGIFILTPGLHRALAVFADSIGAINNSFKKAAPLFSRNIVGLKFKPGCETSP